MAKVTAKMSGTTSPKRAEMYSGKPSTPSRQTKQYGIGSAKDNMSTKKIAGNTKVTKGRGNPNKDTTSTGMGKRKVVPTKLEQS